MALLIRTTAFSALAIGIAAPLIYGSTGRWDELYDKWILHNTLEPILLATLIFVVGRQASIHRLLLVLATTSLLGSLSTLGTAIVARNLDPALASDLDLREGVAADLARSELSLVTRVAFVFSESTWVFAVGGLLTFGLLWVTGRGLPGWRWRAVEVWAAAATLGLFLTFAVPVHPWGDDPYPPYDDGIWAALAGVFVLLLLVATALSVTSVVVRYRRSRGIERRQLRWVGWAAGSAATLMVAGFFSDVFLFDDFESQVGFKAATVLAITIFYFGYGMAIWRHQLFDVDVVISRTIRFGILAAFIGAVYVAIVFGVGEAIGASSDSDGLALTATVVVAFLFQPVRRWAERAANRLVFGRRATPYEVLSDLTSRLGHAETSSGLLDRIVERLAEGTGAEVAVLWEETDDGLRPRSSWPVDADVGDVPGDAVMIEREARRLGALSVQKPRGEELTPTEERLLGDLAGSAGLVLDKARLDAALADQAGRLHDSRRRLMDAEEEERQRLERLLHDGAQQQLVGVKVQLGAAASHARDEGAEELAQQIDQLAADTQVALEEIRALAQGIYPPLLESDGLFVAVRALAHSIPMSIDVSTVGDVDHDDDIEAAVYFCVAEALTNVVKHAEASHVSVELQRFVDRLGFVVRDNGRGFDLAALNGDSTGIAGIADRLAAVGGIVEIESELGFGTTVTGLASVDVEELVPV